MAKKTLWKDNTTPPTNYLWLKVDPFGEVVGLFEWDGRRWVKIANGDDQTESGSITFTDLEGNSHTISSFKGTEGGLEILDKDGAVIGSLASVTYVQNNYLAKDGDIDDMVEDAVNDSLYDEDTDELGNTIYVLKPEIIEQIIERTNTWIED